MNEEPFDRPHPQAARWAVFSLTPKLGALAASRELVRESLRVWHLPHLSDDVTLVVTELVTNAARSGQPITVRFGAINEGTMVRVEVFDADPTMPEPRAEADPYAESGRGLAIVRAYSADRGALPVPGGKVMWAEIGPHARV